MDHVTPVNTLQPDSQDALDSPPISDGTKSESNTGENKELSVPVTAGGALLPLYLHSPSEVLNSRTRVTEIELACDSDPEDTEQDTGSYNNLQLQQNTEHTHTNTDISPVETLRCYLCKPPRSKLFNARFSDIRSIMSKYASSKPVIFYLKIQVMDTKQVNIAPAILVPFEATRMFIPDEKEYVANRTNIKNELVPFNRPNLTIVNIKEYKSRLYKNKDEITTNYPGIEIENNSYVDFTIYNAEGTLVPLMCYQTYTELIKTDIKPGHRGYHKFINYTLSSQSILRRSLPIFQETYTDFEIELCILNYKERFFLINDIKMAFNFSSKSEITTRHALVTNKRYKINRLDQELWYASHNLNHNYCKQLISDHVPTHIGCSECSDMTISGLILKQSIGSEEENLGITDGKVYDKVFDNMEAKQREEAVAHLDKLDMLVEYNKKWKEKSTNV